MMISSSALKWNVDEERLRKTLFCESSLNPEAVGDGGYSFGIAQIHLPSHPEITKEQALNPEWSIDYIAEQFSKEKAKMWTCWRIYYQVNP